MAANTLQFGSGVSDAVLDVKNEGSGTNWALFGYKPKTNELKVDGTGDGGLAEFIEELNDGKVLFGFVGFAINQTHKYLYVPWCGEGVDGMRKGLFGAHAQEMEKWLGQGGRGFHLQINARTTGDLKESIILDQLNKVSSFIKVTSLKKAATGAEKEKEKSAEYWTAQKQTDQAHAKAVTTHEAEKQKRLAAGKDAEAARLQKEAQATLGAMDERRAEDAASFKAQQEDIAKKQADAREANRNKILGDQAAQKQSSHVQADAVHGVSAKPQVQGRVAASSSFTPSSTPAPAPAPAKKAPGKLAAPSAFKASATTSTSAAAPPPAKAKPAPPPVRAKAPEPEPEPEPEAEPEQTYEEPAATYEEPEQTYEEPAAEYEEPAAEETYTEEQSAYPQCRGLYYYAAEAETDLTFNEGDIINILDDTDPDGWWKGELNGAEGFFPSNFVERL